MFTTLLLSEIYLDGVIIYGETDEEFTKNVYLALKRFREFSIAINHTKRTFYRASETQYTGHVLNAIGLSFDKKKRTDKVLNFPKPTTKQDL